MRFGPRHLMSTAASLVGAILVLVVAVELYGRFRLRSARTEFERAVGPLALSEFRLAELPGEQNAATWLRAGSEALVASEDQMAAVHALVTAPVGSAPEQTRAVAERVAEENRRALELLSRSIELKSSSFELDYQNGFDMEIPPLVELNRAAAIVRADSRLALSAGDVERLARDLAILDRLATALAQESSLVTAILALSLDRTFLLAAHDVVAHGIDDRDLVVDLSERLARRPASETLRRSFAAAAAVAVSNPRALLAGDGAPLWERALVGRFEKLQQAGLLDGWREIAGVLDRPWAETRDRFALPASSQPAAPWDVHWFMLPNVLSAVERLKANESMAVLARESVGLRIRQLAGSNLPLELALENRDPYTGDSFRYERLDDGAATLSVPGALELWRRENGSAGNQPEPVFAWKLPVGERAPTNR